MAESPSPSPRDLTIDLRAVLVFVTGADHPPPMGFPNSPETPHCMYLWTIIIPSIKDPDYFREKMDFAICCAHGFGNP